MDAGQVPRRERDLRGYAKLLFGFREPVDRRTYLIAGISLMGIKYLVDATLVLLVTGVVWTPLDYLSPLVSLRMNRFDATDDVDLIGFQVAMALWTLPFLWIGVSMTVRRGLDAGVNAGTALLMYFVPFLNYVWMLLLCVLPSARTDPARAKAGAAAQSLGLRTTVSVLIAVSVSGVLFAFAIYVLRSYGSMVFIGLPVLIGAVAAFVYDAGEGRPSREAMLVATLAVCASGGLLLLFAAEGFICVAMALPIAVPMALLGALIGRALSLARSTGAGTAALLMLGFAGMSALEARLAEPAPNAVTTTVDVDAPREAVWRHVVSFSELPPPTWTPFLLGVAHPVRATINGHGVGAVRRCEFSTGAFVEPITAWEEPSRLAFDVTEQPPAMREWSLHDEVHPPHLDGYFTSTRGEFRLIALTPERTRLEGTTWYELRFAPAHYWRLWSDLILHRIHGEVLAHVKQLAESQAR